MVAVSERNAGVSRAGGGGGHAGADLERDAGGGQGFDLLAAAAEQKRIAALEPQHAFALARQGLQLGIDLVLWLGVLVA